MNGDWQRVDARVLGQILAAQNVMFVLPDRTRIAEFFSEVLGAVPGVISCVVCFGNLLVPVEASGETCSQCVVFRADRGKLPVMSQSFSCGLISRKDLRVIPLRTAEDAYGCFVLDLADADVFQPYSPFINNLANYVAISLENRMRKLLLEEARDELEERVKERVEELRQMNERFSLATRAADLGVWDWDREEDTVVWDDRMYELYGVSRADFPDPSEAWMEAVHPDDRASVETILGQAEEGDGGYDAEFRVVWPDSSVHYIKAYGQFVRNAKGKPFRMTGINCDITDRKHAETEILQLNQELEQRVRDRTSQLEAANRELEAFAYSVSHDLRAPLRHINGLMELLRQQLTGNLDDRSRRYLTTISNSADRMGQLIDDLLAFSRVGRNEMSKRQVCLNPLIQQIIEEFGSETQGRSIRWYIASIPTVTGDLMMLRLVMVNLIANALKFTRQRPQVEIVIGCERTEAETVVFVRDNGVGFDMKYSHKLFGVFQRLHRVDEFEGTGIGLANVRQIIQRHGGRTWAEGKVGYGATVYFSLPHPCGQMPPEGPAPIHVRL